MDLNQDGKMDIVAGNEDGAIWFFRNIGSEGRPEYAEGVRLKSEGKAIGAAVTKYENVDGEYMQVVVKPASSELAHKYSKIDITDWNGDGLHDILVGHDEGVFVLYLNIGKKNDPSFRKPELIELEEGEFPFRPSPLLVDWDNDGKKDLLVGSDAGEIYFYRNEGIEEKRRFLSGVPLKAGGEVIRKGKRARIEVTDWNNDGKPDILLGDYAITKVPGSRKVIKGGNLWLFLQQ